MVGRFQSTLYQSRDEQYLPPWTTRRPIDWLSINLKNISVRKKATAESNGILDCDTRRRYIFRDETGKLVVDSKKTREYAKKIE